MAKKTKTKPKRTLQDVANDYDKRSTRMETSIRRSKQAEALRVEKIRANNIARKQNAAAAAKTRATLKHKAAMKKVGGPRRAPRRKS